MVFVHRGRQIIVKPDNAIAAYFGGMASAFGGKLIFILLCALRLT